MYPNAYTEARKSFFVKLVKLVCMEGYIHGSKNPIRKSKGKSKHLKENGSENTDFPNLWDAPKGVITGKLMAMQPKLSPKGIREKEKKKILGNVSRRMVIIWS